MDKPRNRHLAHVPSFRDSPIVFFSVTTRDRRRILNNIAAHEILREIWGQSADRNGWYVGDYVLMPDHVHFFARASAVAEPMHRWMKMWKSISSRELTMAIGEAPPLWQEEYFDRYLRTGESYSEKWSYVEMNPVRAGMVQSPDQWEYKGRIHELRA